MHGLVNRALERFVVDIYGRETWSEITSAATLGFDTFEPMLNYDHTITDLVIRATAFELGKPVGGLLEDLGHYLVTHPNCEAIRRLLRFGGADFEDFLTSLDELPGRARLALPSATFPDVCVCDDGTGSFALTVDARLRGIGYVLLGAIRAMADDYGALAVVEHRGDHLGKERLAIELVEPRYAEGRTFQLARRSLA